MIDIDFPTPVSQIPKVHKKKKKKKKQSGNKCLCILSIKKDRKRNHFYIPRVQTTKGNGKN